MGFACESSDGALVILAVTPREVPEAERALVRIDGRGFASLNANLDQARSLELRRSPRVWIGGAEIPPTSLSALTPTSITLQMPVLSPGTYPLTVTRDDGRTRTDPAGITVLPAALPGPAQAPGVDAVDPAPEVVPEVESDAASPAPAPPDLGVPDATPKPVVVSLQGFAPPRKMPELESPVLDDDPTLTGDLLEIIFSRQDVAQAGLGDLYRARRVSAQSPWIEVEPIQGLNSEFDEATPWMSDNGLLLLFSSDRPPSERNDIWMTARATRNDPWQAPQRIREVSTAL
ncbi:MAG: hypothetical protein RJA70_3107, partial [Pseudomonadota bacterium]